MEPKKVIEQELARLASFPEQNPNPVMEVAIGSGKITYINPAGKSRFPELMETGFDHPLFEEVRKRISLQKDFECEVHLTEYIFEQKIYFSADTSHIRVYSSDITRMKQIEKNLSRLASFPEQNPSPIIEVDQEMKISYFNPATLIHFPDFYARKFEHPVLSGLKNNFDRFFSGELSVFSEEVQIGSKHYDQRSRFLADNKVIRMFSIDISQLKLAEEIIRQRNKDITDSIHYAKRIQLALLPTEKYIERILKKSKDGSL